MDKITNVTVATSENLSATEDLCKKIEASVTSNKGYFLALVDEDTDSVEFVYKEGISTDSKTNEQKKYDLSQMLGKVFSANVELTAIISKGSFITGLERTRRIMINPDSTREQKMLATNCMLKVLTGQSLTQEECVFMNGLQAPNNKPDSVSSSLMDNPKEDKNTDKEQQVNIPINKKPDQIM